MGVEVILGSDDKWERELQLKKERGKIEGFEENDELLEGEKHW
ncbi:hypothetical protein ES703_95383 [subsurface metagenome]